MTTSKPGSIRLVALASLVGTTIEWYDFFLYGTAAALVFNKLFFPTFDPLMGTLAAFGTYSVGFVARPIGGIVIGHYGDKIGRKSMLVLTLMIMGVATFCIGLLPTYAQIGPWAPVLLVAAAHRAGIRRRRRMGRRGADGGRARAAGQARLLRQLAADRRAGRPAAVDRRVLRRSRGCRRSSSSSWGWRVPFLLSIVLVGVGLVIRLAHPRDAGVRAAEGDAARKRGSRSSRCCGSTRRKCCWRWARGSPRTAPSTSTPCSCWSTRRSTSHMDRNVVLNGHPDRARRSSWRRSRSTARCRIASAAGRSICSARSCTALLAYPLFWLLDTGSTPLVVAGAAARGARARHARDVRAAGGVLLRAVRHARALQRRVAGRRSCRRCSPAACRRSSPRRCCAGYGRGALSLYMIGMAVVTIVVGRPGDRDACITISSGLEDQLDEDVEDLGCFRR